MFQSFTESFTPLQLNPDTAHRGLIGLCLCVVVVFAASLVTRTELVDKDGHRLPPGPRLRYAFLRRYPERVLQRWKERYGPLLSFWLGNQLFVVISDPVIVKDLIVTNGSAFSGRKPYFIKNQTILHGRAVTASQYGDKWRQHRRIAMTLLFPSAIHGYSHVIDYEALVLLRSLYRQGQAGKVAFNPTHYTGRFTLNNMLTISYVHGTHGALQ